jgi:hypothetical protein
MSNATRCSNFHGNLSGWFRKVECWTVLEQGSRIIALRFLLFLYAVEDAQVNLWKQAVLCCKILYELFQPKLTVFCSHLQGNVYCAQRGTVYICTSKI